MTDVSEEWRPVVGWEGLYEVSSLGRVRSVSRFVHYSDGRKPVWTPGRIRKTSKISPRYGHLKVCLVIHDQGTNRSVHSLVAEAFIGPRPDPEIDIRHLNGVADDNRVENLAYGTKSENAQDMLRHGTCFQANKTHCPREHEYTPDNTYLHPTTGARHCRTCRKEYSRTYYAEHSEHLRAQIKARPNYQDVLKKHREFYYPRYREVRRARRRARREQEQFRNPTEEA